MNKFENIDWENNENKWFLAFSSYLLRNTHTVINGLTEDDGIEWVFEMFNSWAKNQNMSKIPTPILKEFLNPCTENVGCINRGDCVVCDNK